MTFWLENRGTVLVEVTEFRRSCDCIQVTLEDNFVEPGEKVLATAKVDFTDDPQFLGRLRLDVTGVTQRGDKAFVIFANVTVDCTF